MSHALVDFFSLNGRAGEMLWTKVKVWESQFGVTYFKTHFTQKLKLNRFLSNPNNFTISLKFITKYSNI